MKDELTKKAFEIQLYLTQFKDKKGNKPNHLKVAFLIENYCELYLKKSKPVWYHKKTEVFK